MKTRCWSSSMAEQLICNQQVAGSIPISSSPDTQDREDTKEVFENVTKRSVHTHGRVHCWIGLVSEGFPSGQREQTVNLSPLASKVRILPPPQKARMDRISDVTYGSIAKCGSSSVGRALAFQARRRGFEPRLPLYRRAAPGQSA